MNNANQNRLKGICPHCQHTLIVNPANQYERCPFCHNRYGPTMANALFNQRIHQLTKKNPNAYYSNNANLKPQNVNNRSVSAKSIDTNTVIVTVLLCLLAIAIYLFIIPDNNSSPDKSVKSNNAAVSLHDGEIQINEGVYDLTGKNYNDVALKLKNYGFTNVNLIEKEVSTSSGKGKSANLVDSITINGRNTFSKGDWFSPNATIRVYYYKLADTQTTVQATKSHTETTVTNTENKASPETDTPTAQGVTPEFKQMMDNYEAFFDEYISFMYKLGDENDSNDLSALGDYFSMLEKEAKIMSEMEAIDEKELSDADAAYYLEVTSRIYQKLMKVTFSLF